jgi:UDP-N-acetyl-D-mannosaminuronate dehydrogenase
MHSVAIDAQAIEKYDLVTVVTDHTSFDYPMIQASASLIFDTRNAYKTAAQNVYKL